MTLLMRDSVDPDLIPLDNLAAVAGYGDGDFQWSSAGWARFKPPIVPLSIVVSPVNAGDILDVENSDATPADVPGWIDRFNRPHRRLPTIYSARGTDASGRVDYSIIEAILAAAAGRPFDWWMATLDGTQTATGAPIQPVAIQYFDFGGYDESIILDPTWIGLPVQPVTTGGHMASAPRPDGSAVDYFFVRSDKTVDHYVWTFKDGMGAPENLAGGLVPWTLDAYWIGSELVVSGQAPDSTIWQNIYDGTVFEGWKSASIKAALPETALTNHAHQFTTSGTTGGPT